MNSKIVTLVLVVMFAVALGAGIVTGKLTSRAAAAPQTLHAGSLVDELQLTDDQRAKMQAIWEVAGKNSEDEVRQAKKVQAELEIAVQGLMTEQQKAQYKSLSEQAAAKIQAIKDSRHDAFKDAVEKTMPILNDSQRNRYRQILHDRQLLPDEAGARSGNVEAPLTNGEKRGKLDVLGLIDVPAISAAG